MAAIATTTTGAVLDSSTTAPEQQQQHQQQQQRQNQQPPSSRHVCPDCGRSYKAVETLNRHRKNHSDVAQYECDVCEATFKRKDLLDRHMHIHSDGHVGSANHRSQRACLRCSRLKTRCDNADPCLRCVRGNHECVYREAPSQNRVSKPQPGSRARTSSNATETAAQQQQRETTPNFRHRNSSNPAAAPHLEQAFVNRTRAPSSANDNPLFAQPDAVLPPFTMDTSNLFQSPNVAGFDWQMDTSWLDSLPQIAPLSFGDINATQPFQDANQGMLWDVGTSTSPPDQYSSHSAKSDPFLSFDPQPAQWGQSPWMQQATLPQQQQQQQQQQPQADIPMEIDSALHPRTPSSRSSLGPRSFQTTPTMTDKLAPRSAPPPKTQIIGDLTRAVLDLRSFYRNPQDRAAFWQKAAKKVELAFGIENSSPNEGHILRQFINVFFEKFNIRFPFVWNRGVDMESTPPYLYLVMSALGAAFGDSPAVEFYGQAIDSLMGRLVLMALQRDLSDDEGFSMCQSLTLIQASMLFFGARKSFFILPQQVGAAVVLLARRINLFNEGGPLNVGRYLGETSPVADEANTRSWIDKQLRRRLAMAILRLEVFISILLGTRPMISFEEINLFIPLNDTCWLSINERNGPTGQEQDAGQSETSYLSDLVRIALDKDEPLPSNLQPYHLESVLYGLQDYVWRFSQDANLSARLDIDFEEDDDSSSDTDAAPGASTHHNHLRRHHSNRHNSSNHHHRPRPERDLLDFSRRAMPDLKNDYARTVSALHKWKRALTSSARADHLQIERKSLLASYLLYNVAFMRLKTDLASLHRLALRCIKDESFTPEQVLPAYSWALSKKGGLALEHACSTWLLVTNELRRPRQARADFNILSSVALLHAAVVVWAYAGAHVEPGVLSLEGGGGGGAHSCSSSSGAGAGSGSGSGVGPGSGSGSGSASTKAGTTTSCAAAGTGTGTGTVTNGSSSTLSSSSSDLRLFRANNFALMQSFAKLLKEVQPMRPGVKTSAYHHTVATLAGRPLPIAGGGS